MILRNILYPVAVVLLCSCIPSASAKECAQLDIGIVVDASGSIQDNWSLLKNFIVDLTGQLDIGFTRVRVGVVKFGSSAALEFSLDSFSTHKELKENVEAMQLLGGKTNTADALRLLRTELFNTNNGDRISITNIAIVITDGKSNTNADQTIPEADLARADGIRVVAVGIGQDQEGKKELEGIAGGPDLVITVKHIDSLSDFIQNTTAIACPPPPQSPCGLRADLVFLLDASSSINFADKRNWDPRLLGFTRSVANSFTIGKNQTRVGVVRFSNKAEIIIHLDQYYDASRLGVAIRDIAYTGGGTNIAEGLKIMREQSFKESNGDRPDISNIALIITDGKANTNTDNILPEADAAKAAGIEIYAIGVSDVDMAELSSIVSKPVKDHIFNVTNYETIGSTLNNFLIKACPSKKTTPKPITTTISTTERTTTPQETTTKVTTPKITTPKITTPKITTPKITTPEITTPEMTTPEITTPKITTPKSTTPEITSPEITTLKTTTPEITTPKITTPKSTTPEITTPEITTPEITTPKTTTPKVTTTKDITTSEVLTTETSVTSPIVTTSILTTTTEPAEITTPFTTLTPNPALCNTEMDVVFVVDSSTKSSFQYRAMLNLTSELVSKMDVESGRIRIGFVTYNTDTTVEFNLNVHKTRDDLIMAIAAFPMRSGRTDHAQALYHLWKYMFKHSNGARGNVKKVAILVTDGGGGGDIVQTVKQGVKVKMAGIEVIAIGGGGWVNEHMLQGIASYPIFKHAFNIQSWNLVALSPLIRNTICIDKHICEDDGNKCKNNGTCYEEQSYNFCKCPPGYAGVECEKECKGSADIVIAIDASGSIHEINYYSVINFVSDLILQFNVDVSNNTNMGMRIGLITFANNANFQFNLNSNKDKLSLLNSLSAGYKANGKTNTADALKYIRENMFTADNGDRKDVQDFVIVITDGKSDKPEDTWHEAIKLRKRGVFVMAVAVGEDVDYTELKSIASTPHSDTIVRSLSFQSLNAALADKIAKPACKNDDPCDSNPCLNGANCTSTAGGFSCTPCPHGYTGVQCERNCDGQIDLVFVLDNSGSIRNERFPMVRDFAANVTSQLDVAPSRVRVGLITFSTNARTEFSLNQYDNKQDVIQAIGYTKFDHNGQTHTSSALYLLRNRTFSPVYGHRPGVMKFAVIITDGNSNIDEKNTIPEAIRAHTAGIHIVVVPVGRAFVNYDEIEGLASRPKQANIISIDSMFSLATIINNVTQSMCNDVNECESNPCLNGGLCSNKLMEFVCKCPVDYTGDRCERKCTKTIDLVFLLDLSGSVEKDYLMTVKFARAVVSGLPIRYERAHVGVVTYASDVKRQFHMNDYDEAEEVKNAMSFHRSRPAGKTNTYAAVHVARTEHFTRENGDRSAVRNVIILVTDGNWNINSEKTIPETTLTKNADIDIYAIAIGESPNIVNLQEASSYPSSEYYIRLQSLQEVETAANTLLDKLCDT